MLKRSLIVEPGLVKNLTFENENYPLAAVHEYSSYLEVVSLLKYILFSLLVSSLLEF